MSSSYLKRIRSVRCFCAESCDLSCPFYVSEKGERWALIIIEMDLPERISKSQKDDVPLRSFGSEDGKMKDRKVTGERKKIAMRNGSEKTTRGEPHTRTESEPRKLWIHVDNPWRNEKRKRETIALHRCTVHRSVQRGRQQDHSETMKLGYTYSIEFVYQ